MSEKTIEGSSPLRLYRSRQCSLVAALETILPDHDYVDLMGLSGAAFRIKVADSDWEEIMGGRMHPGVSVDACEGPHVDAIRQATGYECATMRRFPNDDARLDLDNAVRMEIDAGRPLLALNLDNCSSWSVVWGYDEGSAGLNLICRSYYAEDLQSYAIAQASDLWTVRQVQDPLPGQKARVGALDLAVKTLTSAVRPVNAKAGWFWHFKPELVSGIDAYDRWIADIRDDEGIASLTEEQQLMYWQGNAWMFDQLRDARIAAAAYIRRLARRFDDEQLTNAATDARSLTSRLDEARPYFPMRTGGYSHDNGWNLPQLKFGHSPDLPYYAEEWTRDKRHDAAEALSVVKAFDEDLLEQLGSVSL